MIARIQISYMEQLASIPSNLVFLVVNNNNNFLNILLIFFVFFSGQNQHLNHFRCWQLFSLLLARVCAYYWLYWLLFVFCVLSKSTGIFRRKNIIHSIYSFSFIEESILSNDEIAMQSAWDPGSNYFNCLLHSLIIIFVKKKSWQ